MSDEILIRTEGRAGRITLNRPKALNALTWEMCLKIDAALKDWAGDAEVALVLIDGAGERAFCAGGDIAEMYRTGTEGDYDYGRRFWADEYRMNARLYEFPKPVVSFLQGFTMGGGVGVGCHGSHRIVGESSKIAMPECGIGLVPDVGGSLLLSRAPGRLGEYLGTTGARMGPGDAIRAGFADHYLPEADWDALKAELCLSGDCEAVDRACEAAPESPLADQQAEIDTHFGGETLGDILRSLRAAESDFARETLEIMSRNAPLSMGCTVEMLHRLRPEATIRDALAQEYRFTYRAMERGDFLEGIRAAIIDKDRAPRWSHELDNLAEEDVAAMLAPLDAQALTFGEEAAT
ncbi:enoyl-CoA hydratase/isomerase family protein [Rhodosalinus halophilus]|uniref:3-hydroxyisobutyryl-CoA hydrolase n=1 Tax=Rhodosalinus halophilus TaxID=2259333 RepID=A0A365U9C8_9RHOB|nr:enoyl-CoA hydratase/isomerase family protein [Rhodosalinus halophilus]RBI85137.1 enoyl-CoA hydratase/isomerase family protein [Rhodosalinus halophilus]